MLKKLTWLCSSQSYHPLALVSTRSTFGGPTAKKVRQGFGHVVVGRDAHIIRADACYRLFKLLQESAKPLEVLVSDAGRIEIELVASSFKRLEC